MNKRGNCYEKKYKAFAIISLLLLSGYCVDTVSAGFVSYEISPNPNTLNLFSNNLENLSVANSIYDGGCTPSGPSSDEEAIVEIMSNSSLSYSQKISVIKELIRFEEPDFQIQLIEKTGLSDECKSNLISECVSTSEEYALLVAELRREALAGSNWLSLPGTFVCYTQLEENYCVPATAQSALKYLTGITSDQQDIADEMGFTLMSSGTMQMLQEYVNQEQTARDYIAKSVSVSKSTMMNNFYVDITLYECPALIRVVTEGVGNWPYRTDGHALCVNAITSDMGQVQMADPYMKYLDPNSSTYYQKYADTVYSAITSYGSGTGYLY